MAHNFHDINGWLLVGIEGHNGFHIFPPMPMWFWKLTLLHPFTMGDKQKPTVLFNGVPSVAHPHEPTILWPHLGIIPDPLDAMTPLHILFGSHKCWLPRGAVEICGEKATCCVIGGPMSLNADCWEYGKWPTSLVLNPGTVQTTPTFGDFLAGALTLAIDLLIDIAFEVVMQLGGALVKKFADDVVKPFFRRGDEVLEEGLEAAAKKADDVAEETAERGAKDLADDGASALPNNKCTTAGHPVDVTSGRVIDSKLDLVLPGPIPLRWERHYSSARALERTSLGRGGWTHSLEQWIERSDRRITLRDREGRDLYFKPIEPGSSAFHRMDRLTLKNGVSFHYEYDPETGWCSKTWGDGGLHVVDIKPDLEQRRTYLTGNAEPRILSWNEDGLVTREESPDGSLLRTWEYDKDQYLVAEGNEHGETKRYEYDDAGNLIRQIDAAGNVTSWDYDGDLLLVRVGPDGQSTRYEHDERGSLTRISYPSQLVYWIDYDRHGRLTAVRTEGYTVSTFTFDDNHNLVSETDSRGAKTVYQYDPLGRPLVRVDASGRRTSVTYDLLGRPTSIQQLDGTCTRWEYDPLGNPTRSIDALGQATCMQYGGTGVITSLTQPGGETWQFDYNGQERLRRVLNPRGEAYTFTYDAAGRIIGERTFDGREIAYRHSSSGRLLRIDYSDGTYRAFTHDVFGNVLSEDSPDGTILVERDRLGRLLQATLQEDGRSVTTRFERDELGRVVAEVQDERALRFEYDARGKRVARVMPDGTVTRYTYDSAGALTGVTQLVEATHGRLREVFDYDAAGALRRMVGELHAHAPDAAPVWEIAPGNLVTRTDHARYAYDRRGRRVRRQEVGASGSGGTTDYSWDCRDRLRQVRLPSGTVVQFVYDAFGRRVRKEITTSDSDEPRVVEFLWDGDTLAAEIDTHRGARGFVHEPGTFSMLLQTEAGDVFTCVNDHLGAPTELLDRDGRVVWSARRSAWGNAVEVYQAPDRMRKVDSPFRLLGQYLDEETGLCSTRFRYFDPELGRWCSPDPLGLRGGLDAFGFVTPTVEVDPLGLANPLDIGTMETLTGAKHVGDNIDAHELLQNAWLVEHGVSTGRSSTVGKKNPAIALPSNRSPGIHQTVGQLQGANGLNDPSNLAKMTAQQNIDKNADLLRQAMIQHGVDPEVADAKIAELKRNADPSSLLLMVHDDAPRAAPGSRLDSPFEGRALLAGPINEEQDPSSDESKLGGIPGYLQPWGMEEEKNAHQQGAGFLFQWSEVSYPRTMKRGPYPFLFGTVYVFSHIDTTSELPDLEQVIGFWQNA